MSYLVVDNVTKIFGKRNRRNTAVDAVSLSVDRGESVGLVGESGSGKSTLARMICGLLRPNTGEIRLDDRDIRTLDWRTLWANVQLVPQDSYSSLNPAMTVREILAEPVRFHLHKPWDSARRTADELLEHVGLDQSLAERRPPQLSGGQRQRIAVARALAVRPSVLVCDEPTSALDVSVQAQIVTLLKRLQREHHFGMIFVTHDLALVRHVVDSVAIMKNGRTVEHVATEQLTIDRVSDDYSRRLLAAVPTLKTGGRATSVPEPQRSHLAS